MAQFICPICIENVTIIPDLCAVTQCGHIFCSGCIEQYLIFNREQKIKPCPLCRRQLITITCTDGKVVLWKEKPENIPCDEPAQQDHFQVTIEDVFLVPQESIEELTGAVGGIWSFLCWIGEMICSRLPSFE